MSTNRTEGDLAEVQWLAALLGNLGHAESPGSAEFEAVKGIDNLVGRLKRQKVRIYRTQSFLPLQILGNSVSSAQKMQSTKH